MPGELDRAENQIKIENSSLWKRKEVERGEVREWDVGVTASRVERKS